jgi:transcriptional regulator with XRE-family HTH domain
MGHARPRPHRLAAKLFLIRRRLGLSQPELAKRLNARTPYELGIPYNHISKYEHDKNEPPLAVLLAYSRVSRIPLERIIDDGLELIG